MSSGAAHVSLSNPTAAIYIFFNVSYVIENNDELHFEHAWVGCNTERELLDVIFELEAIAVFRQLKN